MVDGAVYATSTSLGAVTEGPFELLPAVSRDGLRTLHWVKVDPEDFDRVCDVNWTLSVEEKYPTIQSRWMENRKRYFMELSRLLLGDPPFPNAVVRYLNGDTLDCRRANLVWASRSELTPQRRPSATSASKFKCVGLDRRDGRWVVWFRRKNLGRFADVEAAARRYDDAAFAHYGPGCYLNFPQRYAGRQKGEAPNELASPELPD
jgi:hypothetical protein